MGYGIELDKVPHASRHKVWACGHADEHHGDTSRLAVDDIDAVVAHMRGQGAELIGEMQYEDTYRLAYIRGPEGIIVGLAEQLR
jgi:hypothetical protein